MSNLSKHPLSLTRTRMDSSAIHPEPAIRQAPGWSIYDAHHSHLMAILARTPSETSETSEKWVRDHLSIEQHWTALNDSKALPGFARFWSQTAKHFEIRAVTHYAENRCKALFWSLLGKQTVTLRNQLLFGNDDQYNSHPFFIWNRLVLLLRYSSYCVGWILLVCCSIGVYWIAFLDTAFYLEDSCW